MLGPGWMERGSKGGLECVDDLILIGDGGWLCLPSRMNCFVCDYRFLGDGGG